MCNVCDVCNAQLFRIDETSQEFQISGSVSFLVDILTIQQSLLAVELSIRSH